MKRLVALLAAALLALLALAVALAPEGPAAETAPAAGGAAPVEPARAAPPVLHCLGEAPRATPAPDGAADDDDDPVLDEDMVFVAEEDLPPDPVQRGDCVLALELTSDLDGSPMDTALELWRIDEPGNEHWRHGDRKLESLKTEDGAARAGDLAPGRYRIHAGGQRQGSEDPPAFEVSGALTTVRLELPAPRPVRVFLRVYQEDGSLATRGEKECVGGSSHFSDRGRPDWVKGRYLRRGVHLRGGCRSMGCGCGRGDGKRHPLEAADGRLLVLASTEPSRTRSTSSTWLVHPEGATPVKVSKDSEQTSDVTYVGACVPWAELHDAIRLPDGRRARDAGARITAEGEARVEGPDEPWTRLSIRIRVQLAGYRDLDYLHTLAHPLRDKVLEPVEPCDRAACACVRRDRRRSVYGRPSRPPRPPMEPGGPPTSLDDDATVRRRGRPGAAPGAAAPPPRSAPGARGRRPSPP